MELTKEIINRNRLESRRDFLNNIIPRIKSGEIKIQFDYRGKTQIFSPDSKQVENLISGCWEEYAEIITKLNKLEQ
jgi:hypothetical protein